MNKYEFKQLLNQIIFFEELKKLTVMKEFKELAETRLKEMIKIREDYLEECKGVIW